MFGRMFGGACGATRFALTAARFGHFLFLVCKDGEASLIKKLISYAKRNRGGFQQEDSRIRS